MLTPCGVCKNCLTNKKNFELDDEDYTILECLKPRNLKKASPGSRKEQINHPVHYGGDTVYEVIKVIEAWGVKLSSWQYCEVHCQGRQERNEVGRFEKGSVVFGPHN